MRCLSGNARRAADNFRIRGSYSVLMPGLVTPGWPPKGPAQRQVSFAGGVLTDGNDLTLLEWSEREFGRLGRDVVVDLGRDYLLTRVEVRCRGKRLHNGRLYLRPDGGRIFVPVRRFDSDDYVDVENNWRRRTSIIRFDKLGLVARQIRVNVHGSHSPRFAELEVWGRAVRERDSRELEPLLPYDPSKLSRPGPVEQVRLLRGLDAIVPRPRRVRKLPGGFRTKLTTRPGYPIDPSAEPGFSSTILRGGPRGGADWRRPGGYRLVVSPRGIELVGFDEAGAVHGTQTLAQIVSDDGTIPCCEIRDWPRFRFRAVRKVPPNRKDMAFNERYIRAVAALKYNRVVHEGLSWAVNLDSWKTRYGKAIDVSDLKKAIEFNTSLGLTTTGGWAIAPTQWVLHLGRPSLVEGRPGEVYLEKGRIKFRKYKGEVLRRLGRVNACPLRVENFEIFSKVVDEICSIYTDEYFFGGVDEPLQWYNGSRWGCCELCRGHDPIQLMADWVGKCSDHIRNKHGRIHMYQTTIILKEHQGEEPGYPGGPKIPMYRIIDRMPKERTALVNWSYGVWRRKKGVQDSSGLNRYLASKGYREIIQNVGYTDASFAICEFTGWAGKDGADFIGATVANYAGQSLEAMGRSFKFLDYVVASEELWSPRTPEPSSPEFASQLVSGLEMVREVVEGRPLPSRRVGPQDFFTVDISKHANRSTVDEKPFDGRGWLDLGPGLDLRGLPSGRNELCGHVFDLLDPRATGGRTCVMVESARRAERLAPPEVEGIAVGRRAASLLFLHAVTGAMEPKSQGAAFGYRIRYEDGTTVEFPVRYRIEVMEWLDQSARGPGDMRIGWFLYGARPAWLGRTASGARVVLYSAEWVNPHPAKKIASVGVSIREESAAPGAALFAISGVRTKPPR